MLSLPLFPSPLFVVTKGVQLGDNDAGIFVGKSDALDVPHVERLQLRDVSKASESAADAFHDDPLLVYSRDTPDAKEPGKIGDKFTKAVWLYNIIYGLNTRIVLTINHGDAIAIFTPAEADVPRSPGRRPLMRFYDYLNKVLGRFLTRYYSPEQKRRQEEISSKMKKLQEDLIGDNAKEMVYLNVLATSPVWQGRGYGSALVRAVTDVADARGRTAFLFSSNINNTAFYNSLGFVSVGEVRLGEDNPTWKHDPVIVPLMVREPKLKLDEKISQLV